MRGIRPKDGDEGIPAEALPCHVVQENTGEHLCIPSLKLFRKFKILVQLLTKGNLGKGKVRRHPMGRNGLREEQKARRLLPFCSIVVCVAR